MRLEVCGATADEVAAIVAALETLRSRAPDASVAARPAASRWKAAARSLDDEYDLLRAKHA